MNSLALTEYAMRIAAERDREQAARRALAAAYGDRIAPAAPAPRRGILARLPRLRPAVR